MSPGDVTCDMVTIVNNTVFLKVAEKVDLKRSHSEENICTWVDIMDVN